MANTKIQSEQIADSAIVTDRIAADAVTTAKIADNVALGGSPTTTTQSASDNSTKIATTEYVTTAISSLIDSAPSTLNTLNEIAAALNDDANFNTTVTNSIAAKLPLAGGTITGTVVFNSAPTFNTAITMGSTLNVASTVGIAGTTVIDSSRNLTNIGTISSGTITVDGEVSVSPSTGTSKVRLTSQGTGSEVFTVNGQRPGVSNTGFAIRNETDQRNDFMLDGSGNATFAGGITFSGDMFGTNSSSNLVIGNSASGNIYLGGGNSNTNNLYLQTGSSIALTLDASNNATFAGTISTSGNIDVNGNNIIDVNQINGTGASGWLDFNMDADNVYPKATSDNQTVLGSVTHMNFVGDSNGNGTGGVFYWGYGVNSSDSGTFTETMNLDRSGNLTTQSTITSNVNSALEYSTTEAAESSLVGSDALALMNNENSSTNGKVSLFMKNTGGGGTASGRITLKNNRSGSSGFGFFLRDNGHTTEQQEKMFLDSDGNATFAGSLSSGAITSTGSSTFTSTGVMDINLVANPPELNFEDTSSTSGTKRARWSLDSNTFSAAGLSNDDNSVTQSLLSFALSSGAATFGGTISSGDITSAGTIASGAATKPTHAVYDSSGNLRAFTHVFNASKGSSGAVNKTLVDVSGLSNFHQAIFIVEYGTRLQGVSDSTTGFVHRVYGLNRFNGGTLNVTETTAIAGSSNSLTHALIDVEIVSNTQYRIRVEFSSTLGVSSFTAGSIRAFGCSDIFPTISFAEGTGGI